MRGTKVKDGIAVSKRSVRKGSPQVIFGQRWKQIRKILVGFWEGKANPAGRGHCKGPEASASLEDWRRSRGAKPP